MQISSDVHKRHMSEAHMLMLAVIASRDTVLASTHLCEWARREMGAGECGSGRR